VLFAVFNPEYSRGVLNNSDNQGMGFSVYEFFWLLSQTTTTLGTWLWDVIVDWGLFQNRNGLRRHLLFRRHVWVYYTAIVLDLVLRFLWTVSLLPQATAGPLYKFQFRVRFFTPPLELFRRSVWSWLRLEHEQSLRDVQEGTTGVRDDTLREKRAYKSKAERTQRLEEIACEVTRLCKAAKCIGSSNKAKAVATGSDSMRGETATTRGGASHADLGNTGALGGSASTSNPGMSHWDEDHAGEADDDDYEDEDALVDAQKNLQKDLVSHRSVILEVCVVLCFFVGLAIWAIMGDH
jgi:hypothetical protein